jgi:hypothetical protein
MNNMERVFGCLRIYIGNMFTKALRNPFDRSCLAMEGTLAGQIIKRSIYLGLLILQSFFHPGYAQNGDNTTHVLFLGNSYFDWDFLPGLFENLCIQSGKEVYVDHYTPSGKTLDFHASSQLTQMKINSQDWDFVVMIGSSALIAYPDSFTSQPVYAAMQKLKEKIMRNSQSTVAVYCMPWAYEDGMAWLEGWTDGYTEMQENILQHTLEYADEFGYLIAPVGWAWYKVLEAKGYPMQYLHISDMSHPTVKGSYLMACTIYTTLFHESPEGNAFLADLPAEEAYYFQSMAAETVLNWPLLWRIGNSNHPLERALVPTYINLYQNFPNPFTERTRIDFELKKEAEIVIHLYNSNGSTLGILKKEVMPRGYHTVRFRRGTLPAGIYYYSLMLGSESHTRKMIILDNW